MRDTPKFISISGVAGSGKTTITNYLKQYFCNQHYTINDFSFAGPLKDALCLWFNWQRDRLDSDFSYKEGNTRDDGSPDPYCHRLGMTRRQIMQKFGTECMRQGMHNDFWIIMADLGLHLGRVPYSDIYVISDGRYINELEWARSLNGYRILVVRTNCPSGQHPDHARSLVTDRSGNSLTTATSHASENEFLNWNDYNEIIVNVVNQNQTTEESLTYFADYLKTTTIPAICNHHNINVK